MTEHFYEEVIQKCGDTILISNVRPATEEEIEECRKLHAEGKCPHTIIKDTPGWLYDFRQCVVCGAGLGAI